MRAASVSAPARSASGSVSRASAASESVLSCQPTMSASAGNRGRMYDGSFDPDALKKRKITADQTSAKRCQWKPLVPLGARQTRGNAAKNTATHGSNPTTRMGRKYHHAPVRRCSLVRKRVKCSWTKKNSKKPGLRDETAMN